MTANPFNSATVLSNPALNAWFDRYTLADGASINRGVSYLAFFLPWVGEVNRFVRVINKVLGSPGRDAQVYEQNGITPLTATNPWQPAPVGGAGTPTQDIEFAQFIAQFDNRDAEQALVSEVYDQKDFQKGAMEYTIWKLWEQQVVIGDPSVTAGQPARIVSADDGWVGARHRDGVSG